MPLARLPWLQLACWWAMCTLAPPLVAQHPFAPGVAFGAYAYPHLDGDRDSWAVQFDLFTELSKDLEPSGDFRRYNDIDRTLGFDQFGLTRVRATPVGVVWWHQAYWAAGGVIWDAPTEFLQNDFAHGLRLLTYVPRKDVVEHVVFGAGSNQTISKAWSILPTLTLRVMGGVGAALSTSYFDWHGQLGGDVRWGLWGFNLQGGGMWRIGTVQDPVHWDRLHLGLHDRYDMWQVFVVLPFDQIAGGSWAPQLRVAYADSDGPFATKGLTGSMRERLWSVALQSPNGQWGVEMWNDFVFKDLGPTFGLGIRWNR